MNRTLAKNIRHLMISTGISSATELSRRCGVPQPTLHRWLAADAREPRHSKLQPIAEYFNVTLDKLLNEDLSTGERRAAPKSTARAQVPLVPINWVPEIDQYLESNDYDTWPAIHLGTTEDAFAVRVDSSLYEPELEAGSVIIVKRNRKPKNGDIVLALEMGASMPLLRKFAVDGDDAYLMPFRETAAMGTVRCDDDMKILGVVSESQKIRKF